MFALPTELKQVYIKNHMLFRNRYFIFFSWALTCFLYLSANAKPAHFKPLEKAILRLSTDKFCQSELIKKTHSQILNSTETVDAQLFRFKNLFRFQTLSAPKDVIIYDGNQYWILQYENKLSPRPYQIARSSNNKSKSPFLVSQLLDYQTLVRSFDIVEKTSTLKSALLKEYQLTPKPTFTFEVKNLVIVIDSNLNKLVRIDYTDDVDNNTALEFKKTTCQAKPPKDLFVFKPKKSEEIIEL